MSKLPIKFKIIAIMDKPFLGSFREIAITASIRPTINDTPEIPIATASNPGDPAPVEAFPELPPPIIMSDRNIKKNGSMSEVIFNL